MAHFIWAKMIQVKFPGYQQNTIQHKIKNQKTVTKASKLWLAKFEGITLSYEVTASNRACKR